MFYAAVSNITGALVVPMRGVELRPSTLRRNATSTPYNIKENKQNGHDQDLSSISTYDGNRYSWESIPTNRFVMREGTLWRC